MTGPGHFLIGHYSVQTQKRYTQIITAFSDQRPQIAQDLCFTINIDLHFNSACGTLHAELQSLIVNMEESESQVRKVGRSCFEKRSFEHKPVEKLAAGDAERLQHSAG